MTAPPLPVIVNSRGGTATAMGAELPARIERAFEEAGRAIELLLVGPEQVSAAVERAARRSSVVAVGGGDGTLGQAAGALSTTKAALAILPLGTRNHLARQIGMPLDLDDAAKVIAAGRREKMDLARAGSQIFVNNASMGLYTRLVRAREAHGWPKWIATIPAALHVLRHLDQRRLSLQVDGAYRMVKTPLLFIGNNRYSLEPGTVGERARLNDGVLSLYALAPKSAGQLVWFGLRSLFGRADPDRDFAAVTEARAVTIDGHRTMRIAFDGEVERVALPLTFEILPGALEVIVP